MKTLTSLTSILLFLIISFGCQLNSSETSPKPATLKAELNSDKAATTEESYPYGEIFSLATIEAELLAIEMGFVPEIGVEDRLELLNYYLELAHSGVFMVVSQYNPIRRPVLPMPICPPKPKHNCRVPKTFISEFSLTVYTENPDIVSSQITTAEGTLAEMSTLEFDEKFNMATVRYNEINPDLKNLESEVSLTTGIPINGDLEEVTIAMEVMADAFL